ncbi:MAG: hypothetical protein LJF06_00960 [Gemmatimonadetes bacterium]|nr:hypothetical protein [Gemmatimonadota bacterium]
MNVTLRLGAGTRRHLFLVAAFLAGGCGGNVVGPSNQPEVGNNTDTFQWQVSNLSGVTQTFTYQWSNTGVAANINQASALTGGSATLTIADAAGTQVYSGSLSNNGTFQSSSGTAGSWTVTVVLSNATGTLNFRLQKP